MAWPDDPLASNSPATPLHELLNAIRGGGPDTGWVSLAVTNASAPSYTAWRRIGNVVYLRGEFYAITPGAVVFTLPSGARPFQRIATTLTLSGGSAYSTIRRAGLWIQTDGTARIDAIEGTAQSSSPGYSINGVSFMVN